MARTGKLSAVLPGANSEVAEGGSGPSPPDASGRRGCAGSGRSVDGLLHDATRPSGVPPLTAAVIERVVELTLAKPPGERTHWTGRAMAKAAGVSHRSVQRIWAAHGLKPHRVKSFKLSNDPKFAAKVQDVVGLYIDPPEHAVVLSVDEKSQIQALDRTQPGLPMKKGRCGPMTLPWSTSSAANNVVVPLRL